MGISLPAGGGKPFRLSVEEYRQLTFGHMKQLPLPDSSFQWNQQLVSQLQAIRKNLRYPVSRKTVLPAVLAIGALLPLLFLTVPVIFRNHSAGSKPVWPLLLVAGAFIVTAVVAGYRYVQTLKFVAVKTGFGLPENIRLLGAFLSENHFAHSQHPEAPEVFQMLSRNFGGKTESREVVIFIADDRRILANSHFAGSRRASAIGSPHYKALAKMLQKWLRGQEEGAAGVVRF